MGDAHDDGGRGRAGGMRTCGLALLAATLVLAPAGPAAGAERLVVFAAASMGQAVETLARQFAARTGIPVASSFAASSALARQIDSGAPADVFISANVRWMDYLAARGRIDRDSRCNLAANRLVLIAPGDSPLALRIAPRFPLAAALGDGRLALGDPDHVPAGLYARQALQALSVWREVESRVVRSADVRAALALVALGEAAAAVVYATDAALSQEVRIVAEFPPATHDPIVYPVALMAGADRPAAAAFLDFLASDEGRAVLAGYGFEPGSETPCPP